MEQDAIAQPASEASATPRVTPLGVAGLVIALVSLLGAALSPWIVAALEPEPATLGQVAVETAGEIKDRLAAKLKRKQYTPPAKLAHIDWSERYPPAVIGAGVLAICFGVVGLVARHDYRLNSVTIATGACAVLLQHALLIAGMLMLILLIAVILHVFQAGI